MGISGETALSSETRLLRAGYSVPDLRGWAAAEDEDRQTTTALRSLSLDLSGHTGRHCGGVFTVSLLNVGR